MTKQDLRKEYKALRSSLSSDIRRKKSAIITESLIKSEFYKNAQTIMCYASFASEVQTDALIDAVLQDGKTLLLPLTHTQDCTLTAHFVKSRNDLICGSYGIYEPAPKSEIIAPSEIELVIVPALCFDEKCYRIGYGKGYYDRFLSQCINATKVGIEYSDCICADTCHDEHDIAVDAVITDTTIIRS